ncbi:hypothetical protein TSAR_008668 [Trichomalopsis sarcophagae]|uniref:Uncharacterized protein n=1 Tax=Trichomalopsis sarcophagae TaxID=543379 RepID=A0A232F264_9HYME|nr:hypothetical protein TSAR_008668 [Trichomalopsis sarcophagae]
MLVTGDNFALMMAIQKGNAEIVKILTEVCPKNSEGKTPFALMEQQGDEDRIKLMLRHIMALS